MSALPHITHPQARETNCIKNPTALLKGKPKEQIAIVCYGSFPLISVFGKKAELAPFLLRRAGLWMSTSATHGSCVHLAFPIPWMWFSYCLLFLFLISYLGLEKHN